MTVREGQREGENLKKLRGACDVRLAFRSLFATTPTAFWLDRDAADQGRRFSVIGGADKGEVVKSDVRANAVIVEQHGVLARHQCNLFEYLNETLRRRAVTTPDLPFEFNCGYVGYFGYEMKAACGAGQRHAASTPDAALLFVDRAIVIDHDRDDTYLLWYGVADDVAAERWFADVIARLREMQPAEMSPAEWSLPRFEPDQSREQYHASIRRCLEHIRNGESYEICLTNTFRARATVPPLDYFEMLRAINPAPHAAFLRFGELAVACSSPESFLRIGTDRTVESKPIKGTARRGRTAVEDARLSEQLRRDVKPRAENLMIVDLLRNDLGRVCEVGSVKVPQLMYVESYATLHQLVSTISGRLRPEVTAVDCLRAAFPGGSMTGAPKLRTLEIIDELETAARGVYSGSIGFLALNGAADLNIVIRTAVFDRHDVRIGAGGAIVALSDPESEWNELLLKTRALESAFACVAAGGMRDTRVAKV